MPPRTALIVKLAAIGDVVMALPMVTALKRDAPNCRLTWMTGQISATLLAGVAAIDEIIVVDERAILAGSAVAKARAVLEAWRALAARAFDLALIAHSDSRYRLLAWPVRAADRRWLGAGSGRPGLVAGRNHTAEYVRLVTGDDANRGDLPDPPAIDAAMNDSVTGEIASGNPAGLPLVVLAPGGARNPARTDNLRRWPVERYAQLAHRLHAEGSAVAIVGDADDAWVRPAFINVPIIDLLGRTDLRSLVALLRTAACAVAHDSGPLHLARLAGVPAVGLFGPTMPRSFVPAGAPTRILWPGHSLPCAPCYDGRNFAACDDNVCMQMIDVDAVAAAVAAQRRPAVVQAR